MERVWIRGTSGSGKTTLGLDLARRMGASAIDLDDLNWLPGWRERPHEEFAASVREVVAGERWVVSGNYGRAQGDLRPRADTVVWLDYPLSVTFGRALRRTFWRCLRGELCCNGNRETFRRSFFARDSILVWCLTTHRRRRRECDAFMAEAGPPGQIRLRHRNPRETAAWLRALA